METKTIESKQWSLKMRDYLKGLIMSVFAAVIAVLYESVKMGSLEFNMDSIKLAAITALLAYLSKNFIEPTKTVTVTKE